MSTIYVVITYKHREGKPVQISIGRAFPFKSLAEIEIIGLRQDQPEIAGDAVTLHDAVAVELVE